jgi:hypothetical protein
MPTDRLAAAEDRTSRLDLHRPSPADAVQVHAILSDPAVWTHYPSLRVTDPAQTDRFLHTRTEGWEHDSLGTWIVRERDAEAVVGFGGCGIAHDAFWNLGYRFAPPCRAAASQPRWRCGRSHGHGSSAPICRWSRTSSLTTVRRRPSRRRGLALVHRGPDPGNPDPAVMRLVFADRALSDAQRDATMR